MNRRMVATLGGIAVGSFAAGFATCRLWLEAQLREELNTSVEAAKRAYEMAAEAAEKKIDGPVTTEDIDFNEVAVHQDVVIENARLHSISLDHQPNAFGEGIVVVEEKADAVPEIMSVHEADYQKAVAAVETPVDVFVSGGVNDYGISYIEDFEFQEEDGRYKYHIDILMDEHVPIFMMEGMQIEDWDQRLGDSILVDFYRLVPPGVNPVLYVRNHQIGEDYEVVMVSQG